MKIANLILILLILPILVKAVEIGAPELFYEEVENKKAFTVDGIEYYIHAFDKLSARIDFLDGSSDILNIGECTIHDGYKICLWRVKSGEDVNFTASEVNKYFNITTQQWKLFPKIGIYKISSAIVLTKTYDKTEFMVNEKIKVTVRVNNTGIESPGTAHYSEEYPPEISIIETIGCKQKNNNISWSGVPKYGGGNHFVYYIKAKKPIDYTQAAYLHIAGDTKEHKEKITVKSSQLLTKTEFSRKQLNIEDTSLITINFANQNKDEQITLDYRIYFPDGLKKIDKTGWSTGKDDHYVYHDTLEPEENKTITFTIKAEKDDSYTIKEDISYEISGLKYSEERATPIEVAVKPLNIVIAKDLAPGYNEIPIRVANPNSNYVYRGIDIEIFTNLPIDRTKAAIGEVGPHETKEVFLLPIDVPENPTEDLYLKVKAVYRTRYGQIFSTEENTTLRGKTEVAEEPKPEIEQPAAIEPEEIETGHNRGWIAILSAFLGISAVIALIVVMISRKRQSSIEDKLKDL